MVWRSVAKVLTFPLRSTTRREPPSSPGSGWSKNATESPFLETLGWLIQPEVSKSTFPMGNSSRFRPFTSRTIARLFPSGDQSAHCTFSSTGRGDPPLSGTLASVPTCAYTPEGRLSIDIAISPEEEIAKSAAPPRLRDRDCGLSGLVINRSVGDPSQEAPYTTDCPLGVKCADRMVPRRKVS